MDKITIQRTVISFYDEDGNLVGEQQSEEILEGKEAEGIQPGKRTFTFMLGKNGYLS